MTTDQSRPELCDWCDDDATTRLPDLPADRGGGWITAPSKPGPSLACDPHVREWGEGRVEPIHDRDEVER